MRFDDQEDSMTVQLEIAGLAIGLAAVVVAACIGIRNERRERRARADEAAAGRRLLQAQQWRVSSMIDRRVEAARNNRQNGGRS